MKDFLGREYQIGDLVVYPVRRKSELTLKKAVVCETPDETYMIKKGLVAYNYSGRRIVLEKPDRCVIVSRFNERNKDA